MKVSSTLLAIAIGVALASSAQAVHLDPNGRGQALIYPYYTVNNGQQTLLSVTNTSATAQAVDVRFGEGYNGRTVLNFRVFLTPFDMWTATVFNLRDAGMPSDGAAILTRDTSCTAPRFSESQTVLADGTQYVSFANFGYAAARSDGGPQSIQRTREGWVEIIALADLAAPLSTAIAHGSNGQAPTGCADVRRLLAGPATTRPSGGLVGNASIINVAQGTILGTRPEALGGFTGTPLLPNPSSTFTGLAAVNDGVGSTVATAHLIDTNGRLQTLTYGGNFGRPIDAVSAVLMADRVHNEYATGQAIGAASDWVLSMPTKPYYTDPAYLPNSGALPPFNELFDQTVDGASRVLNISWTMFNRETVTMSSGGCGFPVPPPGEPPPFTLKAAGTVLSFSSTSFECPTPDEPPSRVLGSSLVTNVRTDVGDAGWLRIDAYQSLPSSAEGKILRGLPVIGFWANNLVNNAVSAGVLANYSVAVRHATSVSCIKASDGTACE